MKKFESLAEIRRVVTVENGTGGSFVGSDGPTPRIEGPLALLWATEQAQTGVPLDHHSPEPTVAVTQLFGGPGDTRFCAVWIAPFTRSQAGGPTMKLRPLREPRDSSWHATHSIDYVTVIQGEVWLELSSGEVRLTAGDVLIQGGVAHAWHNRAAEPCLMYSVIVGAAEAA